MRARGRPLRDHRRRGRRARLARTAATAPNAAPTAGTRCLRSARDEALPRLRRRRRRRVGEPRRHLRRQRRRRGGDRRRRHDARSRAGLQRRRGGRRRQQRSVGRRRRGRGVRDGDRREGTERERRGRRGTHERHFRHGADVWRGRRRRQLQLHRTPQQAPGGDGIGGFGQGDTNVLTGNEKGRDGFGGGGGGGSNKTTYIAADGGCGVVVIRLSNTDAVSEDPRFTVSATEPLPDGAVFTVAVSEAGSLASQGTVEVVARNRGRRRRGMRRRARSPEPSGRSGRASASVRTRCAPTGSGRRTPTSRRSSCGTTAAARRRPRRSGLSTTALVEERWVWPAGGSAGPVAVPERRRQQHRPPDRRLDPRAVTVQNGTVAAGITNHGTAAGTPLRHRLPGRVRPLVDHRRRHHLPLHGLSSSRPGRPTLLRHLLGRLHRFEIDGRASSAATASAPSPARRRAGTPSPSGLACERRQQLGVMPGWTLGFGYNTKGEATPSARPAPTGSVSRTPRTTSSCAPSRGRTVDISSWASTRAPGPRRSRPRSARGTPRRPSSPSGAPSTAARTTNGWAHVARRERRRRRRGGDRELHRSGHVGPHLLPLRRRRRQATSSRGARASSWTSRTRRSPSRA